MNSDFFNLEIAGEFANSQAEFSALPYQSQYLPPPLLTKSLLLPYMILTGGGVSMNTAFGQQLRN